MIGIYAIKNKINNKTYIGKSTNIANRFIRHRYLLNAEKHYNCHLQRAWNKYSSLSFEFLILEECQSDKLAEKEQYWVNNTPNIQLKEV